VLIPPPGQPAKTPASEAAPVQGKPSGGLVDYPRIKQDFDRDGRSKKVVFVARCVIDQNARHCDCADFPAMMEPRCGVESSYETTAWLKQQLER
jgi:hypothetical protein